jgi:uncharacterized protein YwgA
MNRLQRAALLLNLLKALKQRGSWCGETHLQKSVFFLEEMCGVPLGFSFVLYRHGPYSFDLSDEITALLADRLLDLQSKPPYGPTLLAGENAERLLANFATTGRRHEPQITFVADHLGSSKVVELERLATALYVTRQSPGETSIDARAARLHELKPHIPIEIAERAVSEIDAMFREAEALPRS